VSETLRLLVVSNMYPSEANPHSGIFVAREVSALQRAGVEVTVEPIAGPRGELDYFGSQARLARTISRTRPQLLHSHFGYTLVATAFLGLPNIVTLYGDDINGESTGRGGITLKSRIGVMVTRKLAHRAERIILQSDAMRHRLPGSLRPRSIVLGSGVDDLHFSPAPKPEARRRLGLGPDELVLVFVHSGRQPTKRLDLALATRAELEARGRATRLLVAEQVPADEIQWHYRAADALLMTSDLEGSPNCVKEALACGTPVVSVAVGDVPDLVTSPEQGIIVERTPAALASGVETVVTRAPAERVSLLPSHLRVSSVAGRLIEIYRSVLDRSD
jgi:glycosyltransferase involved in cell wall biosynthesis